MSKLKGSNLAGGKGKRGRVKNDYYATPPESTKALLDRVKFEGENILEPAAGEGHISEVLKDYYPNKEIVSTDLIDRGYGEGGVDFLEYDYGRKFDNIITNPPFRDSKEFTIKGLENLKTGGKLALFLKIQFLESKKRKGLFEDYPPKYIYVFSSRQNPWRNGSPVDENGKKWSSTMCFAWFVWEKGNYTEPIVRWI